jgi:hypothetical protein
LRPYSLPVGKYWEKIAKQIKPKETLNKSFDKPRTNGKPLIPSW